MTIYTAVYLWHFLQSQIYSHKGLMYGHMFISVLMNMKTVIINCSEVYLTFSNKKNIDFLLLSTQKINKKRRGKEKYSNNLCC